MLGVGAGVKAVGQAAPAPNTAYSYFRVGAARRCRPPPQPTLLGWPAAKRKGSDSRSLPERFVLIGQKSTSVAPAPKSAAQMYLITVRMNFRFLFIAVLLF